MKCENRKFWTFIVAQLVFEMTFSQAERDFLIIGTGVECVHKIPKLIKNFDCNIVQRSNRTFGNFTLELFQTFPALSVRSILSMQRSFMGPMVLFNIEIDACIFLRIFHKKRVFAVFMKNLKRFMNEVPKCPFKSNFKYTVKNFYFDEEDLPTYTPAGNYRNIFFFSTGNVSSRNYSGHFAVNFKIFNPNERQKKASGKRAIKLENLDSAL